MGLRSSNSPPTIGRVLQVEEAKRTLSTAHQATVEVAGLGGETVAETLSRTRFEQLNADLFKRCSGPLTKLLEEAAVEKEEVDEIILVGGSTRIPAVQVTHPIHTRLFSAAAQGLALRDR